MIRYVPGIFLPIMLVTVVWGAADEDVRTSNPDVARVAIDMVAEDIQSSATYRQHVVEIKDFQFVATPGSVGIGDTIVFVNRDVVPHTATGDNNRWDSGALVARASWRIVVTADMEMDYFCKFHPSMRGTFQFRRGSDDP